VSTDQARPSAVDAAAGARAARLLGWAGVVLPPMTLFGVGVLPAVVLNVDAHEARQAAGDGPQLDSDTLVVWELARVGRARPAVGGVRVRAADPEP